MNVIFKKRCQKERVQFINSLLYNREQWWVYSFLDWRIGPSAAIWYIAISIFILICFFVQVMVHMFRDWIAKKLFAKKYYANNTMVKEQLDVDTTEEKVTKVHQTSNFEPLASTIGGGSRITFGDSLADTPTNESSIYY